MTATQLTRIHRSKLSGAGVCHWMHGARDRRGRMRKVGAGTPMNGKKSINRRHADAPPVVTMPQDVLVLVTLSGNIAGSHLGSWAPRSPLQSPTEERPRTFAVGRTLPESGFLPAVGRRIPTERGHMCFNVPLHTLAISARTE